MKKQNLVISSAVALLLVFAVATYMYSSQQAAKQAQIANENASALIKPHSPRTGNPDAKVTIVEFLDPACETCRVFYPLVKDILASHDGKVNLVIRYAPFHQGSDYVVKILEAAKKQGKFWQVLELVLEFQPYWAAHHNPQPMLIWGYLEQYGFNVEQLKKDMDDPAILTVLEQDIADGKMLGANKTPSFFVNGKPLTSFGYEQLKALVKAEVDAQY